MGLAGQVGEFGGELVGEVDAMSNDQAIAYLLKKMQQRYEEMPATERVNATPVGRSELGGVKEDAAYKAAEDQALREMLSSALKGGMTDRDKAKLAEAKLSGLSYERGVRGAQEQSLRSRGLAGSGADVASALAAQQGGIDRAYRGDIQTAADSSDRALAALSAAGNYASRLGGRDLEQKNLAAGANDRISMFNAGRTDDASMYNSRVGHQDWLDQNQGLDNQALLEMGIQSKGADDKRRKWRGYGKQAGGLVESGGSLAGGRGKGDAGFGGFFEGDGGF